jgi:ABC-2 type transport system permease protein
MRHVLAVFGKELRSYFYSPIAYVVIGIFLAISGYFFYGLLAQFLEFSLRSTIQAQYYRTLPPVMNVNEYVVRPLFLNLSIIGLFVMPAITMRLYAEEKKQGTIELLMTSPISIFQTILGKFLSALFLFVVMVAPTLIYYGILEAYGAPEWGPIISGFIGLILFGATFVALGLLISATTENQIIAAVATFGLFLILWVIDWLGSYASGTVQAVLSYLSLTGHYDDFAKGVIDSQNIIFYLSLISLGLFLTYRTIESMRWRA